MTSVKLEPQVVAAIAVERQSYHVPAEDLRTGHRRAGDFWWTSGSLYESVGSAHRGGTGCGPAGRAGAWISISR